MRGRRQLAVLAAVVAAFLAAPSHAASIAYENVRFMTGTSVQVFDDQFTLAPELPAGQYVATLEDRGFFDPFELLGLAVDSSAGNLAELEAPGTSAPFDLQHGVTYFVGVVGLPGGDSNISRFAVNVSLVPIPAPVVLLASALAGLVLVRRRKSASAPAAS